MELLENKEHPETDMLLVNYTEKEEFIEDCPKVSLTVYTHIKQFNLYFHKTNKLYSPWENECFILIRIVSFINMTSPSLIFIFTRRATIPTAGARSLWVEIYRFVQFLQPQVHTHIIVPAIVLSLLRN
jgi:hypothetical protein